MFSCKLSLSYSSWGIKNIDCTFFNLKCLNNFAITKSGTSLVWVPLIKIEHLNGITDCKFGRHDTEYYNK